MEQENEGERPKAVNCSYIRILKLCVEDINTESHCMNRLSIILTNQKIPYLFSGFVEL